MRKEKTDWEPGNWFGEREQGVWKLAIVIALIGVMLLAIFDRS